MKYPNLSEEKKLWKKGYKRVACLDEAGRGPLSGPVVAAAVIIKNLKTELPFVEAKVKKRTKSSSPLKIKNFKDLKDSKQLSPKKRKEFYKLITKNPDMEWGIGKVSEKIIDRINILEATKLAMKKAIQQLKRKPDFLILDGNFKINSSIPQRSIIKADEKVFSCAAASILAKVTRDRIMERFDKKYPQYGFGQHKGYPTKLHRKMLKKYGICKIHRKSFRPVKKMIL